jgi:hypothetical protein
MADRFGRSYKAWQRLYADGHGTEGASQSLTYPCDTTEDSMSTRRRLTVPGLVLANAIAFAFIINPARSQTPVIGGDFCDEGEASSCRCYAGDPFQPAGCYEDDGGTHCDDWEDCEGGWE